jgi:hypothetical protein
LELPAGSYSAVIKSVNARVGNKYRADVQFAYMVHNRKKYSSFLHKGEFSDVSDAKDVYEGLAVSFEHGGGITEWWLPAEPGTLASGLISIAISERRVLTPHSVTVGYCTMPLAVVVVHENRWKLQDCDGCVLNLFGQDFAVVSVPSDADCYEMFKSFGKVGFAFPTFDGVKLLVNSDLKFKFDKSVSDRAIGLIRDGKFFRKTGNVNFDVVLFPI